MSGLRSKSVISARREHKAPNGIIGSQANRYVQYHFEFVVGGLNYHAP